MTITKLIEALEKKKALHGGDVKCTAFQHAEEEESCSEISSLSFNEDDQTLHIM